MQGLEITRLWACVNFVSQYSSLLPPLHSNASVQVCCIYGTCDYCLYLSISDFIE